MSGPPDQSAEEFFDLVDETGRIIGQASRSEVHGNPELLHLVVHVLVFGSDGRLFLQKRSDDKDVQPGKWDTSVGGHVDAGESVAQAVRRELAEELGVPGAGSRDPELRFLYRYIHRNDYESELVTTYMCRWDGPFVLQESELADGRFWKLREIDRNAGDPRPGDGSGSGMFTPNFLDELRRWRDIGAPRP